MRAVFAICALCFALAIYSGHRIVSETHLHPSSEPSRVPGMAKSQHRYSIAALDQEQRIRAGQLAGVGILRPSTFDRIMDALSGR